MTMPITAASDVAETIARHPSTGPIFLQRGRLHQSPLGSLYATYPRQTLGEYAALSGLAIEPLLELLNAAAEAAQFPERPSGNRGPSAGGRRRQREPIAPIGSIGYTGTYRERSGDFADVSVVSVQGARGPV